MWPMVWCWRGARRGDDVVFGSVLSGRMGGMAGVDRMMGIFINTLPVRIKLQGVSVVKAMHSVQELLVDLLKYEQTPLAVAQRCSALDNGATLFSAVLNYRHSHGSNDASVQAGMEVVEAKERTNIRLLSRLMISVRGLGLMYRQMLQWLILPA